MNTRFIFLAALAVPLLINRMAPGILPRTWRWLARRLGSVVSE